MAALLGARGVCVLRRFCASVIPSRQDQWYSQYTPHIHSTYIQEQWILDLGARSPLFRGSAASCVRRALPGLTI